MTTAAFTKAPFKHGEKKWHITCILCCDQVLYLFISRLKCPKLIIDSFNSQPFRKVKWFFLPSNHCKNHLELLPSNVSYLKPAGYLNTIFNYLKLAQLVVMVISITCLSMWAVQLRWGSVSELVLPWQHWDRPCSLKLTLPLKFFRWISKKTSFFFFFFPDPLLCSFFERHLGRSRGQKHKNNLETHRPPLAFAPPHHCWLQLCHPAAGFVNADH